MKAILLIDMPKDCWDCHLVDEWGNCEAIKITSEKYGMSIKQYSNGERPSWCSLRPLPHKLQADWYTDGYKEGFNACLEEITEETECITQKKDT